jgi:nucleotide-binding universal stress UspA family protein
MTQATRDSMITIGNIVCPIDFSDYSRRALDHAIAIARRYDSTITLVHVCATMPAVAYAGGLPAVQPAVLTPDERHRLLTDLRELAQAEAGSGLRIDAAVREGNEVREILSEADQRKADLLTVGTHGRSGFDRLLLGSVTEKLLRKASCPVLTVPRHHPDAVPASPLVFKRIVCPVDFSDCSMGALKYAMALTQEVDGELTILYVVTNDLTPLPGQSPDDAPDYSMSVAEFFIKREQNVRRMLKDAIPETVSTYCHVDTQLRHGRSAAEILRLAADRDSDLIVIGVRGRGSADLAVFGSTTQQVVRQSTCPVLTVRGN